MNKGEEIIGDWFAARGWTPFPFQQEVWQYYHKGYHGLLNAPTGSGKTHAMWLPVLMEWINDHPEDHQKPAKGLQMLWITPLRALAKDIKKAMDEVLTELDIPWQVAVRSGDTPTAERQKQRRKMPEVLITTPESIHILFASKGYEDIFKDLKAVVVDEWHELLGTKRGVQTELALSRIRHIKKGIRTWGISATIGNLKEAKDVLLGPNFKEKSIIVKAEFEKTIELQSVLPDEIEHLPWAGHLGIKLLDKVLPIIDNSRSTLIFTNTRSQSEIWYQYLLDKKPELAGLIAIHHGSLDKELRDWVEDSLHEGSLKAVICTSSLDLGVDFRPVETVIQIGSPKGVARFLQRAGRSGHQPNAISRIYFLPTHALELVEASALKKAVKNLVVEKKDPVYNAFDVLVQYLVTLAVSDGFESEKVYKEVKATNAYKFITDEQWQWALKFIISGGKSLNQYDEYKKVIWKEGKFVVEDRRIAMRHRMSIGTIVGDLNIKVKFVSGQYLGSIEEGFISKLKPGDVFWFAGRPLEFVQMKDNNALVRIAKHQKGMVPSWMGGRMPLSSQLSKILREEYNNASGKGYKSIEMQSLKSLFFLQEQRSAIPRSTEFLIEKFESKEGHHLFFYPFEGRLVHEVLGALFGYRISNLKPITFSIAMNDYGFELLSDEEVPLEQAIEQGLFEVDNLLDDIQQSVNATEMARRKFRDIAAIAGLIFQGFPHKMKQGKHLQASSSLIFQVFNEYEPDNLLLRQAYQEAFDDQIEEVRLREAMNRINTQKIIITNPQKPSPLCFPIMVDRMRDKISSEKLEDRVRKMQLELEKD